MLQHIVDHVKIKFRFTFNLSSKYEFSLSKIYRFEGEAVAFFPAATCATRKILKQRTGGKNCTNNERDSLIGNEKNVK